MDKKVVYKCPFYDECKDRNQEWFYFDDRPRNIFHYTICIAPFLALKGDKTTPICALTIDEDELSNYSEVIKQLTLYKKPLKKRISNFIKGLNL